MRISLFLNSTMSKTCAQPRRKDWCHQDQSLRSVKRPFQDSATFSGKPASSHQLRPSTSVAHDRQFPDLLNACYEIKWLFNSQTTFSQALDNAVTQFGALVLLAVTLLLLSVQVAGLALVLSSTVTMPFGFQFLLASAFLISATAFKIMY